MPRLKRPPSPPEPDGAPRAWLALALGLALLLGLESAWDQLPFISDHWTPTQFLGAPTPVAPSA